MLGMFFLAVLYLQRVLGYDAFATGVSFLPISLAIGVLSLGFSARLITRFGAAHRAAAGAGVDGRRPRRCSPGVPVDGRYVVDLPARAAADGHRRRPRPSRR